MTTVDLCAANRAVGVQVRDFILNVPDAKEESITDYLVWKWRSFDARFHYVNVRTFTRQEESAKTGADFELELWLVGRSKCIPLLFQAKKFIHPFGRYFEKLNYPNYSQAQLQKLISYATARGLLPFYSIYTDFLPDRLSCSDRKNLETGVYMINAQEIERFANGEHGRRFSLSDLLRHSNPFHCMFCCSQGTDGGYFQDYLRSQMEANVVHQFSEMPAYAQQLLNSGTGRGNNKRAARKVSSNVYPPVRAVGVYDLRDRE